MGLRQKPNPKCRPKFLGPIKVIERVTPVSYRIDTQNNKQTKDRVYIDRMKKRWVDRVDTHNNHAPPNTKTKIRLRNIRLHPNLDVNKCQ